MNLSQSNSFSTFKLDTVRLQLLASSIMTSNKLQQISAYQQILMNIDSLSQLLSCLCNSKEIYFVTSQLILKLLKTNSNELKEKINFNTTIMFNQPLNLQQQRARILKMYQLILERYSQILCANIQSLQKYQYNQAKQIITHCISQILNFTNEMQQPHINFIKLFFPAYYDEKMKSNGLMLQFLTNYQPFGNSLAHNNKNIVLPQNVKLYQVLIRAMTEVIFMKQNWQDDKYTQSQFMVNHRMFKNKFLNEWIQFTIEQVRIVFNLYLYENQGVLFSELVIEDMIKLLYEVIMFSYESAIQTTYEWLKQKFVWFPQYLFPEGILQYLGADCSFLLTLHKVYKKLMLRRQSFFTCQLILRIYGRVFFLKGIEVFQNKSALQATKLQILIELISNPQLYVVSGQQTQKINSLNDCMNQRILVQGLTEILSQFIIYGLSFQKFNVLVQNIQQIISAKILQVHNSLSNNPQQNIMISLQKELSFFYHLAAALLQHYLSNSRFYTKTCQSLIRVVKVLLKITSESNGQIELSPSLFKFYEQIIAVLSDKSFNSKQILDIIFELQQQSINITISKLTLDSNKIVQQNMGNYYDLKNKPTNQRCLQLVKNIMKISCKRLITINVSQLNSLLNVLVKIQKEFTIKNQFKEEFCYLKQFVQKYLNQSLLVNVPSKNNCKNYIKSSIYYQQLIKFIKLYIAFMQLKLNCFSEQYQSHCIVALNNSIIQLFKNNQCIENLLIYFVAIQQIIKSYQNNKLFVIDLFTDTIKIYIQDINKNYRTLIKQNSKFYQITKNLLLTVLEVVQLFGGSSWGTKYQKSVFNDSQSQNSGSFHKAHSHGKLFATNNEILWEQNIRDNQLPLIVQQYFYTWVKELGRQEHQIQNQEAWAKQKFISNNKQIITIYTQYIHLNPTGKLPPLPKHLVEKQKSVFDEMIKQDESQKSPPLDDFAPKETQTTKLLVRLYLENLYRVSNTTLMAIYPSIDYRVQYVAKWWQQIMARSIKPEINVSYVYKKFIIYGSSSQLNQSNRQLANILYQIAEFYRNDGQFIQKCIEEVYRIKIFTVNKQNDTAVNTKGFGVLKQYISQKSHIVTFFESKKDYIKRLLLFWQYGQRF